jgi:Holliday junction resolvasome RuvABC endonuclease subunit
MRKYLGFDPGLRTPTVVIVREDGTLEDVQRLPTLLLKEDASPARVAERLVLITTGLFELLAKLRPAMWGFEGYSFGSAHKSHEMGELGGVVRYRSYVLSQRGAVTFPVVVSPTSLKKFVTGRGNADKVAVAVAVHTLWNFTMPDEHGYDAAAVAQMIRGLDGAYPGMLAYQTTALSQVSR